MTRRTRHRAARVRPRRPTDHLLEARYPFPPREILSADEVAHIHQEAKRLLQEHGMRVLLGEARTILAEAGAAVDDDMVRIPAELIDHAVAAAPSSLNRRKGDEAATGVALVAISSSP